MGPSPDEVTRNEAGGRRGSPWRAAGIVLVGLYAMIGIGLMVAALPRESLAPPQPHPAAAPPLGSYEHPDLSGDEEAELEESADEESEDEQAEDDAAWARYLPFAAGGMERSRPVSVRIPRIGVDASIMPVGVDDQGEIEVPSIEQAHLAGWYELGPSPGEVGNAVIVGHVDSYLLGKAVFFDLGALRPGDGIEVLREDGTVARFVVDGVASFPKEAFPTDLVYGASDRPGLRLVTCGGQFNQATGEYLDNVIVFATLEEPTDDPTREASEVGARVTPLDFAEHTTPDWTGTVPLDGDGSVQPYGGSNVHPLHRTEETW